MIISASRRTDIPAFYSEWFMNRIRAGWCEVPNPLNYHQLSYVSLKPEDVAVIVFWSKNPKPLISYLDEIDQRGFRYYFQFTLNDYPQDLEPRLPPVSERLETFKRLSDRLDNLRVIWRYDPVIISNRTPLDYHVDKFSKIARVLKGYTRRVMVSFIDYYRKTDFRLQDLEQSGYEFVRDFEHTSESSFLMKELGEIALQNGMAIHTCAEEVDFSSVGVSPGCCIDPDLINRIWSIKADVKKDPTQRSVCLCAVSKDIGVNDTCMHGCPYCYATRKLEAAEKRYSQHDLSSPVLWGETRPLSSAEQAQLLATRML